MARIGFWQMLLSDGISWWERDAINGAYDQVDLISAQGEATRYRLMTAEERMRQMSREIIMLRSALTVLVNTLRDGNLVDPAVLDARLEAALDEAFPPPPSNEPAKPVELAPITCIRCRESVPPEKTVLTGDGPVCDPCSAKM